MLTLRQLVTQTASIRSKFNKTASYTDPRIEPGSRYDNSVLVRCTFDTLTDKTDSYDNTYRDGKYYDTVIKFSNLRFVTEEDPNHPWPVQFLRNRPPHWMAKPSLSHTDCAVSCTCKDFYFMWMWWDRQRNSFSNVDFIPYTHTPDRKNKDGTIRKRRGPVNPGMVPGVCKHIARLAQHFAAEGFLIS